jgi:hypothetical protein
MRQLHKKVHIMPHSGWIFLASHAHLFWIS